MEWYEKSGFDANPFTTEPGKSAETAVGLDRQLEELEYYAGSGAFVFVEGEPGSGKSVLLKKLANHLGGKAVQADAAQGKVDVGGILKRKASLMSRLTGSSPKNIVLMVDNAESLEAPALESIKYNYDNNHFGAVILAGKSLKSARLSESVRDRIGARVVRIQPLTEDEAILLVKNRIGGRDLLSDDAIRRLYRASGRNAKRLLQVCEKTCARVAESMEKTRQVRGNA